MKNYLIFFCFCMLGLGLTAQDFYFDPAIPGQKNNRYAKDGFTFIIFNKTKTIDTTEGSFIKRKGHTTNFVRVKRKEIFPSTVDSMLVFTKKKGLSTDTMKAHSVEDKFLFNTVTGSIKCYNMVPYTSKLFSIYFQKENGPLEYNTNKFRRKTLKEWVSDDAESLAYWKKSRKRKLLRTAGPWGTMVAGFAAVGILDKKGKDVASGLTLLGTGLSATLWLFIEPIHPSKIIEKYNANKRKDEKFFID